MDLVTPGLGLIFWTTLIFLILLVLLKKFAWSPILKAVKDREENIKGSLESAEKARNEMAQLNAKNETLLNEARAERDVMLKEAREAKTRVIDEAKGDAKKEADKIIAQAKTQIESEKLAAISEIKTQVATLSIEIAEKILRGELSSDDKQKALAEKLAEDVNLN